MKVRNIQDYYKHHIGSIIGNLARRGDKWLAGVNTQEQVEYYYSKYKLPKIVLANDGRGETTVDNPSSKLDSFTSVPATIRFDVEKEERIDVVLKFEDSDPTISHIFTSDRNGFFVRADISLQNAKEILQKYNQEIMQLVNRRNIEIENGNRQFREQLVNIITERKSKLKAQTEMIEQLSKIIPITIKTKPLSPVVPLAKKKSIIINPPKLQAFANPEIDPKILEAIIDVLVRGGCTFETAPETFAKLEEEELRNILISFLNGNFELRAVGEAFNKLGKADISLRYSGNNLFVAECKYWRGAQGYYEAIDQLFGYLTWRESIGVLITFVREKDFTTIIKKAKESTSSHTTYIADSLRDKVGSYFVSRHIFPEDKDKKIVVHHLLFTLHSPRKP